VLAPDETLTLVTRFAILTLGWADGQLSCTSDPQGMAGIRRGGFCDHPKFRSDADQFGSNQLGIVGCSRQLLTYPVNAEIR